MSSQRYSNSLAEQEFREHSSSSSLSERVGFWLRSAKAIAVSASNEIVLQLESVEAAWRLPSFRLVFIGEFSRGKSTLINRLLGKDVLPVGILPTTATLTSLKAASEERMEVWFGDDRREIRPLEELSWDDLLAIDQDGNDNDTSAEVRITLNNAWLSQIDVELIDTPGAGDLSGPRAALVMRLLDQCDAAILLISATSPFSLTESVFLEQEVIGKHIPKILVAISKLDAIPYEQRAKVLNSIKEKVAQCSVDINVVPLHPITDDETEEQSLESARTCISEIIVKEDRRLWRSERIAERIVDCLDHLIGLTEHIVSAIKMSATERTEALKKVQFENRKASFIWEEIRLELEKRRLEHNKKLKAEINQAKLELLEVLLAELDKTSDPKSWWERDLPLRLRREMLIFSRKFESFVATAFSKDVEWLQAELLRAFAIKVGQQIYNPTETGEIKPELHQFDLMDVKMQRVWTKIGGGVSSIGNLVAGSLATSILGVAAASFSIPITITGILTSVGVGIYVDQRLQRTIEDQRKLLTQDLESALSQAIQKFNDALVEHLYQVYSLLFEQTKREQQAWQSAKEKALQIKDYSSKEQLCQEIITNSSHLKEEIITALSAIKTSY